MTSRRGIFGRRGALWLAAVAAVAALAALPARAQTQNWDDVVKAGKAEGKLVLYTAFVGQPSTKAVAKAFETKYGITVDVLEARASEIRERVRVEQAAGRFLADVMFTSEGQTKLYDREDKSVEAIPVTPNAAKIKERFKLKVPMASVMTIPYGILVNTGMVKAGDEPKSWKDLTDAKWKGKILADDPRAVGGGYLWAFVMHDAFGESFNQQLAENTPTFTRDQRESQRRVARGEFALYAPFILTDTASLKGLPVKAIIPAEGTPYVLYGNVLLKNAPHPNAARLYIDFLQGPEAQLIYAAEGHGPVVDGLGEMVSPDVRPIAEAKLLGTSDSDRQNEMIDRFKRTYK
jgi:iron(III) transport system substrate-binding protein